MTEPYRMFTSRAEFRLSLREDNADIRLTEVGRALSVVDNARWDAFNRKRDAVSRETERLKSTWVSLATLPSEDAEPVLDRGIEREYALTDSLHRPNVTYETLMDIQGGKYALESSLAEDSLLAEQIREQAGIGIRYHGYITRQADEVGRLGANENTRPSADLDYSQVRGLSTEVQQELAKHKPETIGQASYISGITPAAVSLLLVHLKKGVLRGQAGPRATPEGETA